MDDKKKYLKTVEDFRDLVKDVEQRVSICEAEIVEADKAFGDIRHYCELEYPTMPSKRTKVCQLIKEYSERRRRAKDELEIIKPLAEMLKKYPNLKTSICTVYNQMNNVNRGSRYYNPRVLKDLFDV